MRHLRLVEPAADSTAEELDEKIRVWLERPRSAGEPRLTWWPDREYTIAELEALAQDVDERIANWHTVTLAMVRLNVPDAVVLRLWVAVRQAVPWLVEKALSWEEYGDDQDDLPYYCVDTLWMIRAEFDPTIEVPWDQLPDISTCKMDPEAIERTNRKERHTIDRLARLWRRQRLASVQAA
ncbi:hypothetical protein AB0H12_27815 [Actinosynnema sp. NPDC023794]